MPHVTEYKLKIDKAEYTVHKQHISGKEILELAHKLPVEQYELRQKLPEGKTQKIGLNDIVDLSQHGIERFMTLPLDQQEG